MANAFAFGRFAWNPTAHAHVILKDWTAMTWGLDEVAVELVSLKSPIENVCLINCEDGTAM